jgi:site-specific DNA-methyltransferase (adenine-specific)
MAGLRWRGEAPSVGSIPTISRLQNKGENVNERFNLFEGNCLEVMKTMDADSIDSIVTDPPYELGFMGKSWDSSGIAFNVEVWQEALRVLKPGGHLIAFSGSRTYHRMAVAIEDAGFEIRDQIMWVYGSGFPKSHNISKTLDKSENNEVWENNAYGGGNSKCDKCGKWMISGSPCQCPKPIVEFKTPAAKQWQGWGTALKPAHEPMVLARKPLIGTVANNVLTFGVGGLNIDGSRVEGDAWTRPPQSDNAIYGKFEPIETQSNTAGRFPANFIHDGSDEVVALFPTVKGQVGMTKDVGGYRFIVGDLDSVQKFTKGTTDSGSAARFFYCAKASKKDRNEGLADLELKSAGFSTRYCLECGKNVPQAGSCGCNAGIEMRPPNPQHNHHPTVKPTSLMQYLVRLVTPPNGIVLDPFLGSGSTGKAAMYEGFNFIGIELTPEYLPIAKARILFALKNKEGELDFEPR